jgi:hypothetical protein
VWCAQSAPRRRQFRPAAEVGSIAALWQPLDGQYALKQYQSTVGNEQHKVNQQQTKFYSYTQQIVGESG